MSQLSKQRMEGWLAGWVNGRTDRHTDRQTDRTNGSSQVSHTALDFRGGYKVQFRRLD